MHADKRAHAQKTSLSSRCITGFVFIIRPIGICVTVNHPRREASFAEKTLDGN